MTREEHLSEAESYYTEALSSFGRAGLPEQKIERAVDDARMALLAIYHLLSAQMERD